VIRAGFTIAKPAIQGDAVFFLTRGDKWTTDFTKARLFTRRCDAAQSYTVNQKSRYRVEGAEIREVTITLA
jgi:hypothetical protein